MTEKTQEAKKPATTVKKASAKPITKKAAIAKSATTTTTEEKPKELTQGQKLLKSMTAQKAAKKALMKGVKSTRVVFDEEGNEANVETVIQKIAPVVTPKKTNKNRPAMKKPEPMKKKRKAEEVEDDKKEEDVKETATDNKKPPKKAKKPKKTKIEIEEMKKDTKQEEALAYVRAFVNDRDSWKFKKVQQIWLLQNLYEIPEEEFDNVLKYLKDLQGSAREKAKKEAEGKLPVKEAPAATSSNILTGYSNVNTGYNDDDFDAEKLLALATAAPAVAAVEEEKEEETAEEDESAEVKRAKLIIKVLS